MDVLEFAIEMFRSLCNDESGRYWGVSLRDGALPHISFWDLDREATWEVVCYVDEADRIKAMKSAVISVSSDYQRHGYAGMQIAAVCAPDGKLIELDWEPTEADNRLAALSGKHSEELFAAWQAEGDEVRSTHVIARLQQQQGLLP